jgi:hypothetical protein
MSVSPGFRKSGATIVKLLRRIERLEARSPARIDIEPYIQAASAILSEQAASAILSEPDIWQRDSTQAQEAMVALWEVYGLEALLLAPH